VLNLVASLKERGLGVVLISHNLENVFEVADRIFVMRLGKRAGDFHTSRTTHEEVLGALTGLREPGSAATNGGEDA
jgi:D-xylose transport system ATP-binding protein